MATNQTGIAIVIKAWLPTGKTLDEQLASLTMLKTAHETGDYAPLLGAAKIEDILTDQRTRRVEDAAPAAEPDPRPAGALAEEIPAPIPADATPAATDDALAERPSLTETDGTVTEPAVTDAAIVTEAPPVRKLARSRQTPELDAARDAAD